MSHESEVGRVWRQPARLLAACEVAAGSFAQRAERCCEGSYLQNHDQGAAYNRPTGVRLVRIRRSHTRRAYIWRLHNLSNCAQHTHTGLTHVGRRLPVRSCSLRSTRERAGGQCIMMIPKGSQPVARGKRASASATPGSRQTTTSLKDAARRDASSQLLARRTRMLLASAAGIPPGCSLDLWPTPCADQGRRLLCKLAPGYRLRSLRDRASCSTGFLACDSWPATQPRKARLLPLPPARIDRLSAASSPFFLRA